MNTNVFQSIALLSALVSVVYSQQSGHLICNPMTNTMTFILTYGGEAINSIFGYDETDNVLCTLPVALANAPPQFITWKKTLEITIDPTAPLPCGVTRLGVTLYQYVVVTQSRVAFAPNDKLYKLQCDINGAKQTTTEDQDLDSTYLTRNERSRIAQTQPRQNFHVETETGINAQINLELYASYVYRSMGMYFDRDDVALSCFSKYYLDVSVEEVEHAEKLMKYQNKRGGRIVLQDIRRPDRDEWGTGLEAMTTALQLEKTVTQTLLDLHKIAETHGDPQTMDFIEGEFLEEQVKHAKKLSDYVTNLKRVGPGLGEYMFNMRLCAAHKQAGSAELNANDCMLNGTHY